MLLLERRPSRALLIDPPARGRLDGCCCILARERAGQHPAMHFHPALQDAVGDVRVLARGGDARSVLHDFIPLVSAHDLSAESPAACHLSRGTGTACDRWERCMECMARSVTTFSRPLS